MQINSEIEQARDNSIVIVPRRLVEKIDRNRDKLSRAGFIELCIDALMDMGDDAEINEAKPNLTRTPTKIQDRLPENEPKVVSRAELDEFKRSIKELLRAYVEYLPPGSLQERGKQECARHITEVLEKQDGQN